MGKCTSGAAARAAGFTLIELMVTVVIVSILASIAIPSYMSSVRKSRRTEARTALLDLAAREERYLATNSAYSSTASDLGYSTLPGPTASGYYTLNVSVTAPSSTAAAQFTATATAVAGTGRTRTPIATCSRSLRPVRRPHGPRAKPRIRRRAAVAGTERLDR